MSYEAPKRPTFTAEPHARRFAIDEMDGVTLVSDVTTSDNETVPAGTPGTVVSVWGSAEAFEVEFDLPFTGLATVVPSMIAGHQRHD